MVLGKNCRSLIYPTRAPTTQKISARKIRRRAQKTELRELIVTMAAKLIKTLKLEVVPLCSHLPSERNLRG